MQYTDVNYYLSLIEKSKLIALRNSLYYFAARYAKLRVDWLLAEDDQKNLIDD